jgi:hypothetical protein
MDSSGHALIYRGRDIMITTDRDHLFTELELPPEHFQPAQSRFERWVRNALLTGFFVVLLLEGWLLAQALLT